VPKNQETKEMLQDKKKTIYKSLFSLMHFSFPFGGGELRAGAGLWLRWRWCWPAE
jgi:hypothetical protein